MQYVVFDMETTGLCVNSSNIIQIGAYRVKDGVVIDKFRSYIKPPVPISYNIYTLTGISNETVADAEPEEVVLPEFVEWLGDDYLVGYNSISFDYKILKASCERIGLKLGKKMGWDVLRLVRQQPFAVENHKLETIQQYMGIALPGKFHDACYDAMVTKLIFDRFINKNIQGEPVAYEEEAKEQKGEGVQYGTIITSKPF